MGYWGEATSTMDWCEINYEVSYYIAEFWNTISSMFIAWIGVIALVSLSRYTSRITDYLLATGIIVIGLGSAAFHATLTYQSQMWDEIPMVWTGSVAAYCYSSMIFPRFDNYFFAILVIWNIVFFCMHLLGGVFSLFAMIFVAITLYMSGCILVLQYRYGTRFTQRLLIIHISLYIVAFALWILDNVHCNTLRENLNPQFHSWWHILAGISIHYGFIFKLLITNIVESETSKPLLPYNQCLLDMDIVSKV
jgi:dihydroceramidase